MASGGALHLDDNSGDDLDLYAALAVCTAATLRRAINDEASGENSPPAPKVFWGSVVGRRPNKRRNFDLALYCILEEYFGINGEPPIYDERDFERRFRVPRVVFMRIYDDIKNEPYWAQTTDATGHMQSHPLQKLVAAFRVVGYGDSYDRCDELVRLSRSTIDEATKRFIDFIVDKYEDIYLRRPNDAELSILLKRNAERGMPGCIGSIDCSHWTWRNCPKAHAGMYQGYKKKRTIVMETVCDEDLYIWHFFFGTPGSNNDLNVLRQSPLYHDVTSGAWPPRTFNFTVNGRSRSLLYYLADGAYPRYPFFATPYPTPQTPQDRAYNRPQEALRKDVERLYAVLTSRFHIALHPARFTTVRRIVLAGKAVAFLHNMAVEHRRGGFLSRRRRGVNVDGSGEPAGAEAAAPGGGASAGATAGDAAVAVAAGAEGAGGGASAGAGAGDAAGAAAAGASAGGGGAPAGGGVEVDMDAVVDPPVGSFLYELRAREEATDADEFAELRDDLAAHIWTDRAALLQPYM